MAVCLMAVCLVAVTAAGATPPPVGPRVPPPGGEVVKPAAPPDSAAAVDAPAEADSAAADSAGAAPSALRWWDAGWLLAQLGPSAGRPAAERAQLFHSTCALFSQALRRHTRLELHESGSPLAWDLPYDLGPGVERMSLWLDGLPTAGAALGEAHCLTVSPLLLGEVRCLAPDPFLDPLGASGDGMIWTASQVPVWEEVPSAVRFTEGVGQSSTEDVIAARQIGRFRAMASYAHANTQGRQYFPNGLQRYQDARFQNLFFQVDGALSPVAARAAVADRTGRYTLSGDRKLFWSCSQATVGAQVPWGPGEGAQVRLTRRADRIQWWGAEDSGRRRSHSVDVAAQAGLRLGSARLLLAAAGERVKVSLASQAGGDSAWTANGIGIATGLRMEGAGRALVASAGWTDPWWTRGHSRARVWLAQQLGVSTSVELEGWIGRAGVFIPRLEPDGDALVREGLHLLDQGSQSDGPVRQLEHIELAGRWQSGGAEISSAAFARRISDALGTDPETAYGLLPGARTTGSLASALGDVTLLGGRLDLRLPLRWGFRLEATSTAVLDPPPERLPVLVAPYHGHGGLFLAGSACRGDLGYELGLIALWQGQWETPRGPVPARLQFDAEVGLVFVGRAHLFVQFRNLTDEYFESATYDEAWGALPYRSSTVGFEWHFLD